MAGPSDALESPWRPLAMRPWFFLGSLASGFWPSDFRCYLDSIGKRDECKSKGCTCVQGRYGMGVYICTLDDTDDTDIGNFLALGLKLFVMLALKKETDLS